MLTMFMDPFENTDIKIIIIQEKTSVTLWHILCICTHVSIKYWFTFNIHLFSPASKIIGYIWISLQLQTGFHFQITDLVNPQILHEFETGVVHTVHTQRLALIYMHKLQNCCKFSGVFFELGKSFLTTCTGLIKSSNATH